MPWPLRDDSLETQRLTMTSDSHPPTLPALSCLGRCITLIESCPFLFPNVTAPFSKRWAESELIF